MRWTVFIFYTHLPEPEEVHIEELSELEDIIEYGPDFDLIDRIEIRYNLSKLK